ncbi:MAG TPA: NUDIX domain-containing protein [Candidatus Kapabacteria bacterium]|nr:NUDIX domain-containing protein [Candidatus Kapabacteria bacterium]
MSDYISTIRAHIGHDVLMLPTTAFVLLDAHDRVLLHRRSDNGRWCCPGGVVEVGETIIESALRELREETDLEAVDPTLFGIFAGEDFVAHYPNGDRTAVVQFVFLTRSWRGEMRLDDESTEAEFFAAADIPDDVPSSHAGFLRAIPAYLRGELVLPIIP